jgi:protein-S-isoprenylcysteine O-methyltransferase Ste14
VSDVLHDLFSNQQIRRVLVKSRWLLSLLLVLPVARFMRPELLPAAVALSLFGQLVQGWCFASLVKNRELSIRGPYLLVRNPMYLGRYFLMLGFVVLLGSRIAVVVFTVVYYLYMLYRVKREEARLNRAYKEEFRSYCSKVHRFWPTFGRLSDPNVRFWDNGMFIENNGHWNILLTLIAYVAVFALHATLFS